LKYYQHFTCTEGGTDITEPDLPEITDCPPPMCCENAYAYQVECYYDEFDEIQCVWDAPWESYPDYPWNTCYELEHGQTCADAGYVSTLWTLDTLSSPCIVSCSCYSDNGSCRSGDLGCVAGDCNGPHGGDLPEIPFECRYTPDP